MYCLHVGGADGVEDGQHLLLFVMLGDEFVAVGAILDHSKRGSTGSLAVGGGYKIFVMFRMVSGGGLGKGLAAQETTGEFDDWGLHLAHPRGKARPKCPKEEMDLKQANG